MTPIDISLPAHVIVRIGRTIWPGGSHPGVAGAFEVSVDDGPVVRLKRNDAAGFTIPPGHHVVTRWQWTVWGPMHPLRTEIDAGAGQTVNVTVNRYQGLSPNGAALGGVFGLAGGLAAGALKAGYSADRPAGDYMDVAP
jgi:hypothetical protein